MKENEENFEEVGNTSSEKENCINKDCIDTAERVGLMLNTISPIVLEFVKELQNNKFELERARLEEKISLAFRAEKAMSGLKLLKLRNLSELRKEANKLGLKVDISGNVIGEEN